MPADDDISVRPSPVIVCGTLAIDVMGRYAGSFERFGARSNLNVSMRLEDLDIQFGGCAMNIAYTLKLLGVDPYPVVRAGRDFHDGYAAHLSRLGIDARGIVIDEQYASSSRAIILSDDFGNQLTAFYPGSTIMSHHAAAHIDAGELARRTGARLAVLAPDVAANMLHHAATLRRAGVPLLADPGQGLSDFHADEADALLRDASWLVVNEHEWLTLQSLLGNRCRDAMRHLHWWVVTHGARGSVIHRQDGSRTTLRAVLPEARSDGLIDHTGCGDAFRGGLLAALASNLAIDTAVTVGALAATFNLETQGCQQHRFTRAEFAARYLQAYGATCPLTAV